MRTPLLQLEKILCTQLKGVGPKTQTRLAKLQLHTAQDLLFHLPLRYEDRTQITPLKNIRVNSSCGIIGTIITTEIKYGTNPALICHLSDDTGIIRVRFFHYAKLKLQFLLRPGMRLYCFGEIRFVGQHREMLHPEYKILVPNELAPISDTLTPIYPTTEGLPQSVLRKLLEQVINIIAKHQEVILPELIPNEILRQWQLPTLISALLYLHHPPKDVSIFALETADNKWKLRLILEELLAQQLSLLQIRSQNKAHTAPILQLQPTIFQDFLTNLPFTLTAAQLRVIQEISTDLAKPQPMLRLLQGDVGCGKTIVALITILHAVTNGYQAAIMAPTEILAEQHFKSMEPLLESLHIKTILLTGKIQGKNRNSITKYIQSGEAKVIIGTHAIFQEKINFADLALVIIDEQHRFGVHQRLQLREKGRKNGSFPHQLIMTATPIPRTLTMTVYADLDCSIIDELPKNRLPVKTIVLSNKRHQEILQHVSDNCRQHHQAYWVCPLIAESEILQCQAAETLAQQLTKQLPDLTIGLIHGRMPSTQKDAIMQQFKAGKIDLLVATTVIEVGVDVPNANLMVIENSERLGLVQIHQLRGRVGRGSKESFCVLLYQPPLSALAQQRLTILRQTNDGFVIAKKDLELRGPGEVLGTKQTGIITMRIADLMRDQHLIPQIQQAATIISQKYQEQIAPLIQRWIATQDKYAEV